jgi:hypothetical protein
MAVQKIVLVVSPTPSVAEALASSVRQCGYTPLVVRGFAEAKRHMTVAPHLLITELKLAEYNGLHLALRAQLNDAPAIVVADASFEHEIEQNGAIWASPAMVMTGEIQGMMVQLLQGAVHMDGGLPWYDAQSASQNTELPAWRRPTPQILH